MGQIKSAHYLQMTKDEQQAQVQTANSVIYLFTLPPNPSPSSTPSADASATQHLKPRPRQFQQLNGNFSGRALPIILSWFFWISPIRSLIFFIRFIIWFALISFMWCDCRHQKRIRLPHHLRSLPSPAEASKRRRYSNG